MHESTIPKTLPKNVKNRLRKKHSVKQNLKPRKNMCSRCPHRPEIESVSCHIGDLEMLSLEEPHFCHKERDGLCRGVVEKMIRHGMTWKTTNNV